MIYMTVTRNIEKSRRKHVAQSCVIAIYSDGMAKTIVFSVTCPNRTLFFKLIDVSGREDDGS